MVLLDASMLLLLLYPNAPAPRDIKTGKPVSEPKKRIDYLVQMLQKSRTKIVIPTPALSEILVRAGEAGLPYISIFERSSVFKVAPFDVSAAIEVALMAKDVWGGRTNKKKVSPVITYAKLKYDRQIVAIGKTLGVTAIYSDDRDLKALAETKSIRAIGIAELPLPPEDTQQGLTFLEV